MFVCVRERESERERVVPGDELVEGGVERDARLGVERRRDGVALCEKGTTLGPLDVNFSQHGPTTRPSVERIAEKAILLPDRV